MRYHVINYIACIATVLLLSVHPIYSIDEPDVITITENAVVVNEALYSIDLSGGYHFILPSHREIIVEYFNYETGVVSARKNIDREHIASVVNRSGKTYLPVQLHITFSTFARDVVLLINILDQNDNAPTFDFPVALVEISESSPDASAVLDPGTDNDEGQNGIRNYTLVDTLDGLFTVSLRFNSDSEISEIRLGVTRSLDRESIPGYILQLVAIEGSDNPRTAYQTLNVTVRDVCDLAPTFLTTRYFPPIVPENTTVNTIIFNNLTVIDKDHNEVIRFSIYEVCRRPKDAQCQIVQEPYPFTLDSEQGTLILNEELDFEEYVRYELSVHATDSCNLRNSATVIVDVEDVNDNAPEVEAFLSEDLSEMELEQNTIGYFTVSDPDSGQNGNFSLQLYEEVNGELVTSNTFQLVVSDLSLQLTQNLDREEQSRYTVVLIATDFGNPRLSTRIDEVLIVQDLNDNAPVINRQNIQSVYELVEGNLMNQLVVTIQAPDEDDPAVGNGNVTYHLPEVSELYPFQDLFVIETINGHLKVAGVIDREMYENLFVVVVAYDNPMNSQDDRLNDTIRINVTLTDVNDNRPQIHYPPNVIEVSENFTTNELLFTVNATDLDTQEFATLSYEIFFEPDDGRFVISGPEVFLGNTPLDYESTTEYDVQIVVSDGDHDVEYPVTLSILNVNDEAPVFSLMSQMVEANIREGSQSMDVLVTTIEVTDPDGMSENVQLSFVSGNSRGHFEIDQETRRITTTTVLDKEMVANYTLVVRAFDGLLSSVRDAVINVNVIDINDNEPFFIGDPYFFQVNEEDPTNTVVDGPGEEEIEADDLDTDQNGEIIFDITGSEPLNAKDWFLIDEGTGRITTRLSIDREAVNIGQDGIVLLQVRASNPAVGNAHPLSHTTSVSVEIIDINDQVPTFPESTVRLTFAENTISGTAIYTATAIDLDAAPNNDILYSLVELTPTIGERFSVDETSGQVTLIGTLDFETEPEVRLTIRAQDPNEAIKNAELLIIINVTDTEDPCLELRGFNPMVSLPEHSSANTVVLSFEATDLAGNPVPTAVYGIVNFDGSRPEKFDIIKENNVANIHTTTPNIDREALVDQGNVDAIYRLNITAENPASSELCQTLRGFLTITITDINDNRPNFASEAYTFEIPENSPLETTVGQVFATDIDQGENKVISYSIENSDVPFSIDDDGNIKTNSSHINRDGPDGIEEYDLVVIARDRGENSQPSSVDVTVIITDVNDNSPVFGPMKPYNISEDAEIDRSVFKIEVTDLDDGEFGRVTLTTGYEENFSPDGNFQLVSDEVFLRRAIDRDLPDHDQFSFEVRARDGGGRSNTAIFTIDVTDVNDNPPVFDLYPLRKEVYENVERGTNHEIARVSATDQDSGENSIVNFEIADSTFKHTFCILQHSGSIHVCPTVENSECTNPITGAENVALDYERRSSYELSIVAYDEANPRHYVFKTIDIEILDVNEHPPAFDTHFVSVVVDEGLDSGAIVLPIKAYDLDNLSGPSTFTYTVHENMEISENFRYQVQEGAIVTSIPLNYNLQDKYILDLRAQESDTTHPRTDTIIVTVYVRNVNDRIPVFDTTLYPTATEILETTNTGDIILTVRAEDADNATHDGVYYEIKSGNIDDAFSIDSLTGDIMVASPLDYDSIQSYTLSVVAKDTGSPQQQSSLTLTITIENVNDEMPIFTESVYEFDFTENSDIGTTVGLVEAPDHDMGDFGRVTYSLLDGDIGYFTVEPNGKIVSLVEIDREAVGFSTRSFRVMASDGGQPPMSSIADVIVNIVDADDHAPRFSRNQYFLRSTASLNPGTVLFNLANEVTDEDIGVNAEFTFTSTHITGNLINVSPNGDITLSAPLPSSPLQLYEAEVTVSSITDPLLSDTAFVRLAIEGDNDHHPEFDQQAGYTVQVREDELVPSSIFSFSDVPERVTDPDTGSNGDIVFEFLESNDFFQIEPSKGVVSLAMSLDFEETKTHTLRVGAVDGNRRTSETTLTVIVLNANDERPYFEDPPVRLVLSPVPRVDIDLFTLSARDDDDGPEGIVNYGLLTSENETSAYFTIDLELGIVRRKGLIPAGYMDNIRVTAYDLGTQTRHTTDVIIQIVFQTPSSAPSFAGVDTIPYIIPVDEDHPQSAVYTFATQSQNSLYRLVYTNAPDGLFSVSKLLGALNLHGPLDFNVRNQYDMFIEAYIEDTTDLDNIIRSSTYLQVIIDVLDVNDNAPVFARSRETINLEEEQPTFSEPVFTARAFDDDSGIFGQLNYAIISGNNGRAFEINSTSGEVSVVGRLDRETQSSYELTIRAFDLSIREPLSSEMTLHVIVDDINDNPPRFIQENNYTVSVFEYPHTQSGARILRIPAFDPDIGRLNYRLYVVETRFRDSIVPNAPAALFDIQFDTATVSVSSSAQLDYESYDYILLRIEASDHGSSVSTYLSIHISDVNENAPDIDYDPEEIVEFWEQEPLNSFVTRVIGTDADEQINGVVTYALDHDEFSIDPYTGTIRNKRLITSTKKRLTLKTLLVNITDQGNPPKATTRVINVKVMDVNNHAPVFEASSYVFSVSINAPMGSVINEISASDMDAAENVGIVFDIPHYYNEAFGLFKIIQSEEVSEERGTLANLTLKDTSNSLWELRPQNYTFRLEAANTSPKPSCAYHFLSSYADVTVVVYPECPTFNFSTYELEVIENDPILSDKILTATSSVGRTVQYAVNETDLPFFIEKATGRLMLVGGLDREMRDNYGFEVIATDSNFQPRTCSVTVTVTVIDVNDNEPVFLSSEHDYTVMENTRLNFLINTSLEASDDDLEENSRLSYAIDEQESEIPFRIESGTGMLYTDGMLDAEERDSYIFMVVATDNGVPPLSSSVLVNITIGDVNEMPPTFTQETFSFPTIEPSSMLDDIIGRITAQDPDKKSQLTFKFANEPPKQYFRIDPSTGDIILNVSARNTQMNKRSVQKRQAESEESDYFTVPTEVEVSDGTRIAKTSFEIMLHKDFQMVTTTSTPATIETYIIIAVVVASVAAVIVVFFFLLIVACICKYRRTNKRVQIKDSRPNNNTIQLERFNSRRSQNSRSSTPGQNKQLSTTMFSPTGHSIRHSSGSRSNSSEQSYSNYADDELDSNNEVMGRSAYNSPGLSKRPPVPSAHARSTSDLASSIGTDMLGSQQLPHPKAKIAAIYAAHHGLLNNHGSQESIHSNHTFASEGGGEADAEADIDNMLYRKYEFDDDDDLDDETTIPDDSSYMGKDQPMTNSVGNIDVPPVEDDISPYGAYSQPGVGEWIPRATPMEHTINELSEMASYSSSQEHHIPVPRYMEHSQPVSMYGASSQGSHMSLLPRHHRQQRAPPRHYDPHMGQHEYDYYGPPPQEPLRHNHGQPQPRYGSATALQDYNIPREQYGARGGVPRTDPRLHQSHSHHRGLLSQDVPPTYLQQGRYIQRGGNAHTPSSDTPTDGTVTPHRAMTQDYDTREYMSSSSTSLGSTNLSGTTSSIGASASQRVYSK